MYTCVLHVPHLGPVINSVYGSCKGRLYVYEGPLSNYSQHIQLSAQQFINSSLSLLTACVCVCVYFEVFYVQLK